MSTASMYRKRCDVCHATVTSPWYEDEADDTPEMDAYYAAADSFYRLGMPDPKGVERKRIQACSLTCLRAAVATLKEDESA